MFYKFHPKSRADWDQKASAALGFIKVTLGKKPHITLTKPQFLKNVFKKPRNLYKILILI
jgi:hypothetical protein